MLTKKQRECLDCKTFIRGRHPKSVRCMNCQRKYDIEYNKKYPKIVIERVKQQEQARIEEIILNKMIELDLDRDKGEPYPSLKEDVGGKQRQCPEGCGDEAVYHQIRVLRDLRKTVSGGGRNERNKILEM